jgi:hypothetical protein
MAPLSGLDTLRPLFCTSLRRSKPPSNAQLLKVSSSAFAIVALVLASSHGIAQQPSPIPNWTPSAPGTSAQYSPNQDSPNQPYGYARQPYDQAQTEQSPTYEQPPDYPQQYGQPQYQQAPDDQQQYSYQPDLNSDPAWGVPDQGPAPSYQPQQALSPDRLEQMVAPIALYPDNLVSMVLAASTYPAEISSADQWLHTQGGAPPEQIAAGANAQTSWDPSVKGLTAFPQVLDTLAQNLQWTTDLGNAYYNQPQDVMQTIQVMRGRAQAAGNLQDTPQQEVVVDQGEIQIAPPTPEIVYVPQYNPWAVYGQPVSPYPDFDWVGAVGSAVGNALIGWGPGIAMDAFAVTPFGWMGWGLDWFSHAIYFGNDVWCPRGYAGRDWGFAHGGARYWGYHGEMARWRERGGWGGHGGRGGGRGGWEGHTFRSGLDRGRNGGSWGHNGGSGWGNRGGSGYGGREGGSWGRNGSGGGDRNGGNWGRNGTGGGNGGSWSHNGGGSGYGGGNGGNWGHNGSGYGGHNGNGGQGYGGGQNGGNWAHNGNGQNGGFGRGGYGLPNGGAFAHGGAEGRVPNGRGLGFSGSPNGGYGQQGRNSQAWQANNHSPQAVGRPQQYGGAHSFGQGHQGYSYSPPQHVYGGNYGRQYGGSSGGYSSRPGFGGNYGQQFRSPSSGYSGRSNNYGGSSGIARAPSNGGGFHLFGGGGRSSNSYGGGSFKAPKAPSYSSHSWGGGGSHFSSGGSRSWGGGGSHFGGGGGSHFSGGGSHFGGGGGHFGGGGHSGGGHSSGGHGGGGHGGGHHH